jgi:hypothetical protein
MAQFFPQLGNDHIAFIREQHVFFVATSCGEGYPNLSPKGYDSLDVLGPGELVYVDLPGSGNQTASHLARGGRATLMFASFDARALILRVYGTGRVVARESADFASLAARLRPGLVGRFTRQLLVIDVDKVQTSCGYGVPRFTYEGDRDTLLRYYERAEATGDLTSKMVRWARLQDPV